MNKRRKLGILSLSLIVFAIIFSNPNFNDFVIGEYLFYKIGIPIYSNGTTGLHYPVVVSFILFFIGIFGIGTYGRDIHPYYHRIILIIILVGPIVYSASYFAIYNTIKTNADGLNSIGFDRRQSSLNFESGENDEFIKFNGVLKLKNYSNNGQYFNIELIPNREYTKELFNEFGGVYATEKSNSPVPEEFYLPPKSEKDINATFYYKEKKGYLSAKGYYKDIDIVLLNGKERKEFIKLVY